MNLDHGLPPAMVLKYLNGRRQELSVPVNDFAQLKTIAHKIRGNAATFGLPQLGSIAGRIEDELLSTNPDSKALERLQSQLLAEVDALVSQAQI